MSRFPCDETIAQIRALKKPRSRAAIACKISSAVWGCCYWSHSVLGLPLSFWSARLSSLVRRLGRVSQTAAMKLLSVFFWGLVLVTGGVSYRWGGMVGLIFFVFMLMIGAVLVSHWGLR